MSELEQLKARAAELDDPNVTIGVALPGYRELLDRAVAIAEKLEHNVQLRDEVIGKLSYDTRYYRITKLEKERDEARAIAEQAVEAVEEWEIRYEHAIAAMKKARAAALALREAAKKDEVESPFTLFALEQVLADTEWLERHR